jgi:Zn-dependent M28 family amino/carboxypeptidase
MTDEISAEDDLLFVGYGIEAPEYKWNDFKGMDVTGKVLVALVNDPDPRVAKFGGESMTYYGRWAYKLEMARRKKAKGIILIHHEREATYDWSVVRNSWVGERFTFADQKDPPLEIYAWIRHTALDEVLKASGLNYEGLKRMSENRKFKPVKLPLKVKASFRQKAREAVCHNVIGVIPGADPILKDEAVIFTGHYDHFGIGLPDESGDRIYNGALDNASGTAALICLARAFAESPIKPKRTLIFMPVTGEELGLLGSTWFVEHPTLDLKKIAMVINKDCMNHFGRRAACSAFPVEYSTALPEVQKLVEAEGLKLTTRTTDPWGGSFRSDHFPFAARGVPAMSVGMSGAFLDRTEESVKAARDQIGFTYHQASDEIHPAWVYDGVLQELELLFRLGRHWADGAVKPAMTIERDNPFWATRIWYGLETLSK